MEIHTYGDPILREKAQAVPAVTDEIRRLADEMVKTMHTADGVGLAAEQVGRTEHLCVIDVPERGDVDEDGVRQNPDIAMPLVLINAEIVNSSEDKVAQEEGCLSFPGMYVPVTRPAEVDVRFTGLDGRERTIHAKALVGRAIQHELDHLNGVLLVDRMSAIKKISLSGRLKRMRHETQERLESAV